MIRSIKLFFVFILLVSFSDPYSIKRISDANFRYEFYTSTKEVKPKATKVYFWFKGGAVHSATSGVSGQVLNGNYKKLYHSNQLAEEGNFKYGLKVGLWKNWFENGTIKSTQYWNSGLQTGLYYEYDASGNTTQKGNYKKGKKHGNWINFVSKDTVMYKNGLVFISKPKLSKEEKQALKEKNKADKKAKATAKENERKAKKIKREQEKKQKEASKGQKSKSGTKKEQPKPQAAKKDNFFKRLFSKKE